MEETPPASKSRSRTTEKKKKKKKESSFKKHEMDAVLQVIRLTRDSPHHHITAPASIDRKVKEEEVQSTGDCAFVSFLSVIQKIMPSDDDDFSSVIQKILLRNMTQRETNAAQQLLQLSDNSSNRCKDVKVEEEEEEESSNSDTSYVTDDHASSATDTQLELNAAQQMMQLSRNSDNKDTEEREKGAKSKGNTSDLCPVIKDVFKEECETFCRRKRKFRSVVDIYRTTKPLIKKARRF